MWPTFFLLGLFLFSYAWYSRMRLKEQALEFAKSAIKERAYQLLDDAIGLSHMRVLRQGRGIYLMQIFEFQYADEHQQRHLGQVIRCGKTWLNVKLHTPMLNTASPSHERKIIPFPGSYRHD